MAYVFFRKNALEEEVEYQEGVVKKLKAKMRTLQQSYDASCEFVFGGKGSLVSWFEQDQEVDVSRGYIPASQDLCTESTCKN